MNSTLSLTQRQMCEKISHQMDISNLKTSGFQAFLSQVLLMKDDPTLNMTKNDLISFGVMDSELHLSSVSWVSDPILNNNLLESKSMYIHHENDTYTNEEEWENLRSTWPTGTLASNIGYPIRDIIATKGFLTLKSYALSQFNFGSTACTFDLVVYVGTVRTKLCTITISSSENISVSDINEYVEDVLRSLSIVTAGTAMIHDLCTALSNGLHSPADLMAVLNHYASSGCSSISSFAKKVLQAGRNSVSDTISLIVQLFRDSGNNYVEDENGNISWNITSNPITSNFWMVAGNIIAGSAQVIGTVLLFSGWVIGKIIGGLLLVGSSIYQAVTQTVGAMTGTTPYICDDAIDLCYHDPIAQQDSVQFKKSEMDGSLLQVLTGYGRAKIVIDSCTIYMYNYHEDGDDITMDMKVFANMSTICPDMGIARYVGDLGWGKDPRYLRVNSGQVKGGFISFFHEEDALANDKGWYFSLNKNEGIDFAPVSGSQTDITQIQSEQSDIYIQFNKNQQYASMVGSLPLSARSADANNWTTLWDVLRANILTTLSYVFCNPWFYTKPGDSGVALNSTASRGYDLNGIVYYAMYTGGYGYVSMVNDIIGLSNFDHSDDLFMQSLLNTCGLYGHGMEVEMIQRVIYQDGGSGYMDIKGRNDSVTKYTQDPEYRYQEVGIFPFLAVDNYSYVTPPSCDFKSIIWGAIIAAAVVAAVVATVVVAKTVISKKVGEFMDRKGRALMNEGETFRNGFTPEEYQQLSPSDQKIYTRAYRSYNLKVKVYNAIAKCLGLSTLDWKNNWFDHSTGALLVPPVTDTSQPNLINAITDSVLSSGVISKYNEDPTYFDENPSDALILYRLISGRNPNSN